MELKQLFILSIETESEILLRVDFSEDPVESLFALQPTTPYKLTLVTITDKVLSCDASDLLYSIKDSIEYIDEVEESSILYHAFSLDDLELVIGMMGTTHEIMKSVSDFSETHQAIYKQKVWQNKDKSLEDVLNSMPDFKSTGSTSADQLIMKLRNNRTKAYKL